MRVLLTGHTGFKGAWLSMWLSHRGHSVCGLALDPEPDSLFVQARVEDFLFRDLRVDIRSADDLSEAVELCSPELVVHMAAQPLVRESYRNPRWTIETNVVGTMNLLEATGRSSEVAAQLIVTTDKVYRNVGRSEGYQEEDPLGGDDPYSASKAMADILTHAWTRSFAGPTTAVARAGNVIGGGDISRDRLIPDVISACRAGQSPVLRYPNAVRPWQHVLDCLNGYQMLLTHMERDLEPGTDAGPWNFGPDESSFVPVHRVTEEVIKRWGGTLTWAPAPDAEFHEAAVLALDSGRANEFLGWRDKLSLSDSIGWTVDWFREVAAGTDARVATLRQIEAFESL